ncbi:MIP family channel protein [Drepanopeziza brunnea f. sp. 'multigermtubi' MB_m1]|uniref:MIP family channel protein n=1 Tax=Marssonina brunnea f. sp. multigermtubi (strain MB_m1) TaxID=1072389 RepID=K1XLX2_MARBU|nr:MIP family channel protein [Drepanopeziza brunnea f. sp. 'multigermtubi' MB_m1]EKD21548.1 MIP family channel protein [Drepanopeziza brunnea f. sp. 'multigermtubi' MB_m1]
MNINEPQQGTGIVLPFFNKRERSSVGGPVKSRTSSLKSNRLPFIGWIPGTARNHLVATIAEFTGTTMFLMFAFAGTQVALLAHPAQPNVIGAVSDVNQLLYISLCFGFSLAVNAWVFFRISGGLFNPAVTLGMCLVGALPYIRGACLTFAQILGGITAAAIVSALLPGPLTVRTGLGGGTSVVQGLFIEMFLTALLVFTIFMLAAEKHKGTFIAPIGIGLALFIAELMGVYYTGGSVNPARSFGPSVVSREFHSYHWIYWVGPILGSIVASGFYLLMKMLEYETANPGQDSAVPEGERFNPDLERGSTARVSFAPGDYAIATKPAAAAAAAAAADGRHGAPKEYGTASRPFSDSPAPPHPNDQYCGLADDSTHGHEVFKPLHASASDMTLTSSISIPGSPTRIMMPPGQPAHKSAIKPGSRGQGGTAHESSMRSNTYQNRIMAAGNHDSEEFGEKD